ncbi:DUF4179 domain-containing protein [Clostridium tunisiense]|uniref:DUF4179 domain-containing protein n=1 Tax=Clostridium tunisiense TaxID=219748 RepID=UPI0002FF18AF|nr:DUF4179 domain-containing protein [Clostridium tunisiense]
MSEFEDIKLPDNIEEVTNRAISRGEEYMKKRSKKNRNLVMAVSLALVVLMGAATPVLAEKVILSNKVFEQLKSDDSISEKQFMLKGGQYKYAQAVNQEIKNNGITMKITEVACDGANIFISYAITMDEPFSHANMLAVVTQNKKMRVDFCDEQFTEANTGGIEGKFIDEFNFVGMDEIDLAPLTARGLKVPDKFNLEIEIGDIIENPGYTDKKVPGPWKFKLEVTKNTSEAKEVKKELVDGEVKFNKMTVTPTTTDIEVTIPNSYPSGVIVTAYDDKGNKLQPTYAQAISKNEKEYVKLGKYSAVSEGSKFVTIKLVNKNDPELKVLNEFKVPIE